VTPSNFNLDHVLDAARNEAGHSNFRTQDFFEPLNIYLGLLKRESLSKEGQIQQQQLIQRCLVNRLRFDHDFLCHPEIAHEDVSDPIIVLGFPRSGTTVLQRMISADPAMQNLALWRVLNPAPFPNEGKAGTIERKAFAKTMEDAIRTYNPALFAAHPMIVDEAEEDWFLHHLTFQHVGNVFWGLWSQEYLTYLRSLSRLPTYQYVADLLRYLQWQDGGKRERRWVLKTPLHVGCLDQLLTVHPRATFIYLHRDFSTVIASFCHALESSIGSSLSIDPKAIGVLAMDYWPAEMQRFYETRRRLGGQLNLREVHYQDLLSDPIHHLRDLYQRAGTQLSVEGERAIRAWIDNNPAGKYGKNVYDLERYGLTSDQVDAAFKETV
jgi:hypothetical protein